MAVPASHGDMPMDRVFTIAAVRTSVGLNTGLRLVHPQGGRLLERLRSVLALADVKDVAANPARLPSPLDWSPRRLWRPFPPHDELRTARSTKGPRMPTLCRAYTTDQEAHAAVDRLLAIGTSDANVRVLMGRPIRDHRDDPVGGFAGRTGESAGTFADAPKSSRSSAGSYAGDPDTQRVGGFGDIDLETVASYHNGVPQISTATHRNLKRMLVEAGLEGAEADEVFAKLGIRSRRELAKALPFVVQLQLALC